MSPLRRDRMMWSCSVAMCPPCGEGCCKGREARALGPRDILAAADDACYERGVFMGEKPARDRQDAPFADTRPFGTLDTEVSSEAPSAAQQVLISRMLPRSGDVIASKYRIERCLGRGGMGAVFSATHLFTDKRVAIKWMLPSTDEKSRRRFMREAKAAGRIDHPNVVDVYDIGEEAGYSYLVMEMLRGESLRNRLERDRLAVGECIALLMPALRGVAAVHQAGVIHRDLKPDNIFLCDSLHGLLPEAKVLDFGISAINTATAADSKLTGVGMLLGTPAYMPPEQLRDSGSVDPRSDVYAFGVILYEALTGVKPFRADSIGGLVLAIAQDQPEHPCSVRPEIPRELAEVVLRAIAKLPDARWPDIESLMAALVPFAPGYAAPTVVAATPAPVPRPRNTRGLLAGVGLAFALAGAAAWLWQSSQAPNLDPSSSVVRPAPRSAAAPAAIAQEPVSERQPIPTVLPDLPEAKASPLPNDERKAAPKRTRASSERPSVPPSAAARPQLSADPPKSQRAQQPAVPSRSGRIDMDDL